MPRDIRLVTSSEEIDYAYSFIAAMPLDYPNYSEWLEKCYREMKMDYKKAFVYSRGGVIVGVAIAQQHKETSDVFEIKSARVEPSYRRRGVFRALYTAVQRFAKEQGFKKVVLDAHESNEEVIRTFERLGFVITRREKLYTSKSLEVILEKNLENGTLSHT